MPYVAPYNIPFPYEPYTLQKDAMTRIRRALERKSIKKFQNTESTDKSVHIIVLESPTGTGKSQILLNSVLSYYFHPLELDWEQGKYLRWIESESMISECDIGANSTVNYPFVQNDPLTLEEMIHQSKLEEKLEIETESLIKSSRQKRRIRRKVDFDPCNRADATEESVVLCTEGLVEEIFDHTDDLHLSSDNEKSSKEDKLHSVHAVECQLASLIPLRKPKIFFSSRTHTQLHQLIEELEKTDFMSKPVLCRDRQISSNERKDYFNLSDHTATNANLGCKRTRSNSPTDNPLWESKQPPKYFLRFVHVAGRQQLCINDHHRKKTERKYQYDTTNEPPTQNLNDICTEAMKFEYSREGKLLRKKAESFICGNVTEMTLSASSPFRRTALKEEIIREIPDLEDVVAVEAGKRKKINNNNSPKDVGISEGCEYCAPHRLRLFMEHLIMLQEERERIKKVDPSPLGDSEGACEGRFSSFKLEELKDLGKKLKACPYIISKLLVRGSDVIFIPYGYMVDKSMRDALFSGVATNETVPQQEYSPGLEFNKGEAPSETDGTIHLTGIPPNLKNDIVVIDEAHNLADYCRSVSSSQLTYQDCLISISLLKAYLNKYQNRFLITSKQRLRELLLFLECLKYFLEATVLSSSTFGSKKANVPDSSLRSFQSFLFDAKVENINVFEILSFIDSSRMLYKIQGFAEHSLQDELAEDGTFAKGNRNRKDILNRYLNLAKSSKGSNTVSSENQGVDNVKEAVSKFPRDPELELKGLWQQILLRGELFSETNQNPAHCDNKTILATISQCLRRLESFLRWFNKSDNSTRVLIKEGDRDPVLLSSMKLIQFEPGASTLFPVMKEVHTTLLAGGTMMPLELTCSPLVADSVSEATSGEKKIDVCFIQEGHVVSQSSVALFALGVGPCGRVLDFSHKSLVSSRENAKRLGKPNELFLELSIALLNLARVLPPAGVVCFFTSYEMERLFSSFLLETGYFSQINEVKRIFREEMYLSISPDALNTKSIVSERLLEDYRSYIVRKGENEVVSTRGALLFSVVGGSLSEGINFGDDLARAVIVIGLPYANPEDLELSAYLEHIAKKRFLSDSSASETEIKNSLYKDLCMRSVNQSIGRCIRHAQDYAAIILLDHRYTTDKPVAKQRGNQNGSISGSIQEKLPKWMIPSLKVAQSFGDCFHGIKKFFESPHT